MWPFTKDDMDGPQEQARRVDRERRRDADEFAAKAAAAAVVLDAKRAALRQAEANLTAARLAEQEAAGAVTAVSVQAQSRDWLHRAALQELADPRFAALAQWAIAACTAARRAWIEGDSRPLVDALKELTAVGQEADALSGQFVEDPECAIHALLDRAAPAAGVLRALVGGLPELGPGALDAMRGQRAA